MLNTTDFMIIFFRYENEKNQAKEIQGENADSNATLWPEIHITNPPACSATIYIQLVEQPKKDFRHQGQEGYVPSPNILFIKKLKNWQPCSNGITVIDDGDGNDGKCTNGHGKFTLLIYLIVPIYFMKRIYVIKFVIVFSLYS